MPAKVISIKCEGGMRFAKVDFGGLVKEVILALSEEVKEGDYVIVHAGIAISKIDEEEVRELSELWREIVKVAYSG